MEQIAEGTAMILTESEIQRSKDRVEAAFPRFTDWQHANEVNADHSGFAVWGWYTPLPNERRPRRLFVTFTTHQETWKGHLTVGKHCYFWSSADVEDAHLLDTGPCATLEEAITALKRQIATLCAALLGEDG